MYPPFEIMLALRYLRVRKAKGFVSVIAAFPFLGIMLWIPTLIIFMSAMKGFRIELIDRIFEGPNKTFLNRLFAIPKCNSS